MKRLLFTLTLIGILSTSAFAGLIPSVGAPAPVGTTDTTSSTSPGEMPTGGATSVSDVELSAVLAVLSLLA
jgi:hypothetical protein